MTRNDKLMLITIFRLIVGLQMTMFAVMLRRMPAEAAIPILDQSTKQMDVIEDAFEAWLEVVDEPSA